MSYSGAPGDSDIDSVRFYTGDTDTTDELLTDDEIQFLIDTYLDQYGHLLAIAALSAEMIAAKLAREVSVNADGVSVAMGDLMQRYNDLAASLRAQYRELGLGEIMGQVTIDPLDPTIPPLAFGVGFMDNPLAGIQDLGRTGNYPVPEF